MGRSRPEDTIHQINKFSHSDRGFKYTIYITDPKTGKKVQKTRQSKKWSRQDALYDFWEVEKRGMEYFENKKTKAELAELAKERKSRYYKLDDVFNLYITAIKKERKPSQIEKVTIIYNAHIKSFFNNRTLMSITQEEIYKWKLHLQTKTKKHTVNETLKAETRNAIISVFRSIVEFGLERNYTNVKLKFTKEDSGGEELSEKVYWKEKDWFKFFSVIDKDNVQDQALFLTLFNTGMRISECRALHPYDINFDEGTIHIRASIGRQSKKDNGVAWIQTMPKGKRARTIGIGKTALFYLKKQIENNIKKGYAHPKKSYIFGGDNPITMNTVSRRFKYYISEMLKEYPDMDPDATIHSIRHSVATFIATRINVVYASEILGHSDISTTSKYVGGGQVPKHVAYDIEKNFEQTSDK